MRNEKGYALIVVLVIITITFTFALSMSGMALSARKQFNKTDELNKATDLAEMGVAHYEAVLNRLIQDSNIAAKQTSWNYDSVFYSKLTELIQKPTNIPVKVIEGSNSYKVIKPEAKKLSDGKISITFQSQGITADSTKILNSTVIAEKKQTSLVGESVPEPRDYVTLVSEPIDLKADTSRYPYSTYFKNTVRVRGGPGQIIISGNAFFDSAIIINGSSNIKIYGDAIFKKKLEIPQGSYTFCVTGKTYYIEDGKVIEYTPFPGGNIRNNSCTKVTNESWYINPKTGIEVTY